VLVLSVTIVPAATLDPAVALQVDPPVAATVHERMLEPWVQVVELVDGLTLNSVYVVAAPEYE